MMTLSTESEPIKDEFSSRREAVGFKFFLRDDATLPQDTGLRELGVLN
jgi:hypothetical protein